VGETFVVIGSNSFSGSHFVDYLLEQGQRVIGVSRSAQPHSVFLPWSRHENAPFEFHQLDLNHHTEEILELVRGSGARYVVNFAAQSMVAQSWDNPEHWYTTNLVSTARLHDGLRQVSHLERYVHVSTPEVYGSCRGAVQPDAPFNPSTPYAVSRAACDMSLRAYFHNYGFPVVFTRAANVFGPGQQLYRIVPRTVLYGLTGRTLQLHGGGTSERSFIHIRDVAEGTYLACLQGTPGATYHMATLELRSIRAIVEEVCRSIDVPFESMVEVSPERAGKDAAYILDCWKTRSDLGWEPKLSFAQGVDETVAWIRENLEVLGEQPQAYVHQA